MEHLFPYEWTLKDAVFTKDQGKVFSCFACGGGSTMGYKLAGYEVIGMNEIDPKMAECYIENHKPKHAFIEPIQEFKKRVDIPEDLYDLDILDGSPPCSSFSMAGNREKDWGKEKKFREGQSNQVLDTLFFDFIDLAKEIKPKIIVAENVKGLLLGEAREYLGKIGAALSDAGYAFDYKLLDSSLMGIPQKRERVFFYAIRRDLVHNIDTVDLFAQVPYLNLDFNEKGILFCEIEDNMGEEINKNSKTYERWMHRTKSDNNFGDITKRINGKASDFNTNIIHSDRIFPTVVSKGCEVKYDRPIKISKSEFCKIGSYPMDYNFLNNKPSYLIGMSVPPVMMAQISYRIYQQWLCKI